MPVTLIVAAAAAVSIILIAFGVASSGGGGITLERLERYAASGRAALPGQKAEGLAELVAQSAALASINRAAYWPCCSATWATPLAAPPAT